MPAPNLVVRPDHLHHLQASAHQMPGETHAIETGALHTDLDDRPESPHPAPRCAVTFWTRHKRLSAQHAARVVNDRGDVSVLVSVDAAVDAGDLIDHDEALPSLPASGVGTTGRDGRQDSQGALPKAAMRSHPPDRSVRASSRDTESTDHQTAQGPVTPRVRSKPRPLTTAS